MLKTVAEQLGNTTAVCRKYYVHPAVIEVYLEGKLSELLAPQEDNPTLAGLEPEEQAVMTLLQQQSARLEKGC